MKLWSTIKPAFWDHEDIAAGPRKHLFNFRRIWRMSVILTAGVALAPLVFMILVDYNVSQRAIEAEINYQTSRLVSNTRRSIAFFLAERQSALNFIDKDNTYPALGNPQRLAALLDTKKGQKIDEAFIDKTLDAWYKAATLEDEKLRLELLEKGTLKQLKASKDPFIKAALRIWPTYKAEEKKSDAKVGMRAEVPTVTLVGPSDILGHVRTGEADLRAAGRLTGTLDLAEGEEVAARDVELVPVARPAR